VVVCLFLDLERLVGQFKRFVIVASFLINNPDILISDRCAGYISCLLSKIQGLLVKIECPVVVAPLLVDDTYLVVALRYAGDGTGLFRNGVL
jgi:hypothetical protein